MSTRRSPDRLLLLLLLGSVGFSAHAATEAQERARIARERDQAMQRYEQQERVCRSQFVVTSCIDDAQAERRVVLDRLAREQAVFDDRDRKARAAEQMQRIDEKRRAAAQRAADAASEPRVVPRQQASSAGGGPRSGASGPPALGMPRLSAPIGAPARKANADAYERRLRQAQAHRAAVERRNRERAAAQKASAPLPAPADAASR